MTSNGEARVLDRKIITDIMDTPTEKQETDRAPEAAAAAAAVDDEEAAGPCSDHDHLDIPILEENFDYDVDTIFNFIFTDHQVYRDFQRVRKTTKLVIGDWSETEEVGEKRRTITSVIAINQSVGPKSANTTEHQIVRSWSRPGEKYVVDSESHTAGVPYGDSFYLWSRFCITKISATSSQLHISSRIVYLKKIWGLVKSFVDKNVKSGTKDSYLCLSQCIRDQKENAQTELPPNDQLKQPKTTLKNRKNTDVKLPSSPSQDTVESETNNNIHTQSLRSSPGKVLNKKCSRRKGTSRANKDFQHKHNTDTLTRYVLIALVVLAFIHVTLYFKLREVEEKTITLTRAREQMWRLARSEGFPDDSQSSAGAAAEGYDAELDTWAGVLRSSAQLMANLQASLEKLQSEVDNKLKYTSDTS